MAPAPHGTTARFRLWRMALLAAIVGFIVAALYISSVLVQRQDTLEATNRSNVTSVIAQSVFEFSRLSQRVSEVAIKGEAGLDEVKLRVDVLANRLRSFKSKHVATFISSTPRNLSTVEELHQAIKAARASLDTLAEPGAPARLLARLEPVYPKLVRLSVDATVWNTAGAEAERNTLVALQWTFVGLAGGLILAGIIFIILLLMHNRLLQRAQDRLKAQDAELHLQNSRFDAALNNMSHGLCLLDSSQRVIVSNQRFQDLFGLTSPHDWQGKPLAELIHPQLLPLSAMDRANLDWAGDRAAEGIGFTAFGDHTHQLSDGTVILVSHEPMRGGGWVSVFEDITERRRAENHIVHVAHHDTLTGLPNRLLFWESTSMTSRRLQAAGQTYAVLYLDLDRFKEVNDTAGHPVGDALLRQVAARLEQQLPPPALVARLGGDEFAVLYPLSDHQADAADLARMLIAEIARPYLVDSAEFTISTSIGIALGPRDGETTDELMRNADMALYRAKKLGAGHFQHFAPEFIEELQERRRLEADLRKALPLDQLELHYQPLVSLKSYTVVCGEALLRWNHPVHGMVSPADFIPLAEETGLIDQLGEWVLHKACQDALRWPAHLRVSVNLSPVQFRNPRLADIVAGALAMSGLPAHRLELEITESVQLQNNSANLETVLRLRALGCRIALDDFGTGYASLGYLTQFQFDKIKIDQTFVRNLTRGSNAMSIIQSIASLSKRLKMVTTAEGVETQEQLDLVIGAGCLEAQGFFFSRPVPLAEFEAFVAAREAQVVRPGFAHA